MNLMSLCKANAEIESEKKRRLNVRRRFLFA